MCKRGAPSSHSRDLERTPWFLEAYSAIFPTMLSSSSPSPRGANVNRHRLTTQGRLVWVWLSVVTLLFYAPVVLFGRVFCLKDTFLVVYPTRLYLRERLSQFELPQWLPHLDMGMPFLANPANGVLYPLNVLLLLPAPYCIGLLIASHAVIAVVGTWVLLRKLGVTPLSSSVGALAFALGGYMVSLTGISPYMMSLAWLPVVAVLMLRSLQSRSFRDVALVALAWSTQILVGEPQGVIMTGWFVLALALSRPTGGVARWRFILPVAFSAVLAVIIALPQILPALELIPRSRRASGISLVEASHWSFHPLRFLELLVPRLFGSPLDFHRFLGFFMDDEGSLGHRDPWIHTPYWGSVLLLFALVGLVSPRVRHRYWTRPLGILLGLVILLAIGRHSPAFGIYFNYVPGAKLLRYPAKFFGLAAAILPLLAAAGLDRWRSNPKLGFPRFGVIALALVLLAGWFLAPNFANALHPLSPEVSLAATKATLRLAIGSELLLVIAGAVLLVWAGKGSTPLLHKGLAGLLVFQVLRVTWGAYCTAPPDLFAAADFTRAILATTPKGDPPRLMHDAVNLDIAGLDAASPAFQAGVFAHSLFKDIGIAQGIGYADSYVSSEEGVKYEFWRNIGIYKRQMLDVFAVHHLGLPADVNLPLNSGLVRLDKLREPSATLYENRTALPFAFAVKNVAFLRDNRDAQLLLRDPRLALGLFAVVDGADVDRRELAELARVGVCRTRGPLTDRIDLECDMQRAGFIVINESFHPNYSAKVDGVPTLIMRTNAFVMGVKANAGKHRVTLEYTESSLLLASIASAIALGLCCVLIRKDRVAA